MEITSWAQFYSRGIGFVVSHPLPQIFNIQHSSDCCDIVIVGSVEFGEGIFGNDGVEMIEKGGEETQPLTGVDLR